VKHEIIVPICWLNGGNMIDRDTLPSSHPESYYGYIKYTLKLKPEDYGIYTDEETLKRRENAAATQEERVQ